MDRGGSGLSNHGLKSGIGRLRAEIFGFVISILVGCDPLLFWNRFEFKRRMGEAVLDMVYIY